MGSATYRASAFLEAAESLGLGLVVGTNGDLVFADANPEGLLPLDFARPLAASRAAADYHARRPLAAVLACDDDGVRAAAAIAERLGLRGSTLASVERALDKRLMRETLADAGVPSPWFEVWPADEDAERLARRVRFPCVLKPPALSASRGVLRADDSAEFVAAFRRVAHVLEDARLSGADREILIEEYLPGVEVAVEGLLTDGRLRVLAVFDKPDPLEGPTFEETLYVTPSRLGSETLAAVEGTVAAMTAALGLTHGAVHAEVRVNASGCWPIEIAPRSIGGLCSRTLRFHEGASLEELLLRHALGQDVGGWNREPAARGVMMIPIPRGGILHRVGGIERAMSVPGVEDVRITIPLGHPVVPLPEGNRYLGFVFAQGEGPAAVESALRRAHERLSFEIHTE
jgi:biotin carboxylase